MGALKAIGYVLAGIAGLAVLFAVGALVTAIVAASGIILTGLAVVVIIALLIEEYRESARKRSSASEGRNA
jgi:uncharacterized membrane protein YuzA (DUF378 family)